MDKDKYVGMDVHKAMTVVAVLDGSGRLVAEAIIETRSETIKDFVRGLSGKIHLTFEEGTQSAWLYELIKPVWLLLKTAAKLYKTCPASQT